MDYVDSKLKKVYSKHLGYQELNDSDKQFFDSIFNIIWFNESENVILKNSYVASKLGYSSSTVEKKFRKLERAGLIVRTLERKNEYGVWTSIRTIALDSDIKALLFKELKLLPNRLISEKLDNKEESIPEESNTKGESENEFIMEKNDFILGARRR